MMRFCTSVFALGLALVPVAATAQVVVGQPVYTTTAPPPPVAENQGPAPGAGYTWVPGFWNWNGSQHAWTPGRWEQPPQPAQAWEPPQWERDQRGYRFRPGRWGGRGGQPGVPVAQPVGVPQVPIAQPVGIPQVPIAQPVGQPPMVNPSQGVVVIPMAPPRLRAERRPPPVRQGQTWIPGFWSWNGSQHTWNPGRWEAPPRPRARWMPAQWVRRGRQWSFSPGRWR